ncbi:MAG: chemotaxis protein CheA [Lachnospiraceae bacterium]|nr:chemotaxis protein CheA [Lachnospiraceae bacterium]
MDVSQYLEVFIEEAKEHLQALNEHLLILEKEPENENTINEIFRAAHSLKGMAGTMGYKRMQHLTHDMENVFQEIRSGKMKVRPELTDCLFEGLDALQEYVDNIINTQDEGTNDNQPLIDALARELDIGLNGEKAEAEPAKPAKEPEKKEEPAAEVKADNNASNVNYAEYEKTAIQEAASEGLFAYEVHVDLQESCLLKAARAYLVFKAVEEFGEIIKSVPDAQMIEDEKFDFSFVVVVLSNGDPENIRKRVLNVSEVKEATVQKVDFGSAAPADTLEKAEQDVKANAESGAEAPTQTPAKPAATAAPQKSGQQTAKKAVVNRSVRVDIEKLDDLMNLVSELIIAKNGLASISGDDFAKKEKKTIYNEQIEYLERITSNIHQSVMKVRMVPIESVVNRFPRMIRDLSKKLDKPMELVMSGEETELDRTVIDEIGDPLMHILRNSADHGLESAEKRKALGKPETGLITLNAFQEGNSVIIECSDDGGGIDTEKVKKKAIEKGTITEEQAETMSEKDFIDLLFRPSFSTAEQVSDVSGRGVGLDVVKSKIESLSGTVECKTVLGQGTTFTIRLPLTLAIIQSLMVTIGDEKYAIPLGSIDTIEDIPKEEVKKVEKKEVINLRGSVIPLIRMAELLDVPGERPERDTVTMVVVAKGDRKAGLVVDELIGQLEIVIKSIGKYINNSKMISGATVLGDGEVALILDANALV